MSSSFDEIRRLRLEKYQAMADAGLSAFPIETKRETDIVTILDKFTTYAKRKKPLSVAGRIMARRGQGAIMFLDLVDGTGKLQAVLKKDEMDEAVFAQFNDFVDVGDMISVSGSLFITNRKEKSILVKEWSMVAKSLRPLPEKWHGLKDVEERFRRRYLDLLMNEEVRNRFILRSNVVASLRTFLQQNGFIEVETPMLQSQAGGATARPFATHHNALDIDLFLRIAPELYLKRLLVGGLPKVFELSRNFRNEGIDVTHNPEFTMLEYYEAWSDKDKQMAFAETLLRTIVKEATGTFKFTFDEQEIDVKKDFTVVSFFDLLQRYAHITDPMNAPIDELVLSAKQVGASVSPSDSREKVLDAIYKKTCRPKLIQPTFIVDYPVDYLPLAKREVKDKNLVDAFQLVIGGLELIKAFSELNDPVDQRARFEEQEKMRKAGDDEAQQIDEDFLEALEYGMPPAGGVGIGVDRLIMLLSDTKNIREVILFPTLRPKN
jgi:lysyl-tRNA synthetase class 2